MPCCARSRSLLICLHLVEHLEEEVGELLLVDPAILVGIGDLEELVELLLSGHVFSNTGGKGLKALLHLCNELFLLDKAIAVYINLCVASNGGWLHNDHCDLPLFIPFQKTYRTFLAFLLPPPPPAPHKKES